MYKFNGTINNETITLSPGVWQISNGIFARICGKCSIVLSLENTGELGHLQPDCNDCTVKNNCEHKWAEYLLLSNPAKKCCILCGFNEVSNERDRNEIAG